MDLSFEWSPINGEVRDELLQEESLAKDNYAVVSDMQPGKAVIVKHLNYSSSNHTEIAQAPHPQGYLILANVIGVFLAMLVWWFWSKRKAPA